MMRVLHLVSDTGRRASTLFACDLAVATQELGQETAVLALARASSAGSGRRPPLEIDLLGSSVSGFAGRRALKSRMAEFDVTVVHGPVAGEACARAAGRKMPFVYRQVRDTRFWSRRPPRPREVPAHIRRARAIVALSPGARSDLIDLLGLPGTKIHVAPIGLPSEPYRVPSSDERWQARQHLGIGLEEFVAVTVGTLGPEKGIDQAIRAVLRTDDTRLVVVGDGSERPRLERLAEGLAPGRVVFTGHMDDPMLGYAVADVVVHPSTAGDSMPRVLIEAGFCGLPVIATPIGSVEYVVAEGRTGLIVPSLDIDGLWAALRALKVGRVGRQNMGEEARLRCLSRFEIDVVAKEWVEVLGSVAGASE